MSTASTRCSAIASAVARLIAVVVLPTPPFWLATAKTRAILGYSTNKCPVTPTVRIDVRRLRIKAVFHVEHSFGPQENGPAPESRKENNGAVDFQAAGCTQICSVRDEQQGFTTGCEGWPD